MIKIKKPLNLKVTSLLISIVFFLTNTACAMEIPKKDYLRKPLMANKGYETQRLKDAIEILSPDSELDPGMTRRDLLTLVLAAALNPMRLIGETNQSIVPDKNSIWRIILDIVDELALKLEIDPVSTEKIKVDLYKEAKDAFDKYRESMPFLLKLMIGADFTKSIPLILRRTVRGYIINNFKPTIQKYAIWVWKLEPAEMRILIQEYDLTKMQVPGFITRALGTEKEGLTIEETVREAGVLFAFIVHFNFIKEGADWREDTASEFSVRLQEINETGGIEYLGRFEAAAEENIADQRPAGFVNKKARESFYDDIAEIYKMSKLNPEGLKDMAEKDSILSQKIALLDYYLDQLKAFYSADISPRDLKVAIIKGKEKNTVKIRITHMPTKITIGGIEVKKPGSIELSIENAIVMASLRRELYKKSLNQLLKESIPASGIGVFL